MNINKRIIKKYNVNLDKDTAIVLSKAFNDILMERQSQKNKINIPTGDKNKENYKIIIKNLEEFINLHFESDNVVKYEIDEIKRLEEKEEYNIEFIKKIFNLTFKLDFTDLIIFILDKNEKEAIKLLKIIANFGTIIPFERFSIQEILYKKFEKTISDINSEMDNYKHINTSIISMILSSISAIGALLTIQKIPKIFQGLIYWFIVILGLVFIFYLFDFIKNLFEIKKRHYILNSLNTFTLAFNEPKNINSDYIKFVKLFLTQIKEYQKSKVSEIDYKIGEKSLKIFMNYKMGNYYRFYFGVLVDILKDKKFLIITIIIYLIIFYQMKNDFIYLLIK